MSSFMTEAERALRIKVFRNGDDCYMGKYFVLNRRRIRTWDSFLQAVTVDVKSNEAVRSIRTPEHGSKIESLDQLAQNKKYVAVGNGRFKKMGYLKLEDHLLPSKNLTPRNIEVKPVVHSKLKVSGRIKSITTEVICINVFANGLELIPAHRVKLKVGMLRNFDVVLGEISEKIEHLTGPVMKLHTMDGFQLTSAEEMKSGDTYVGVGREIRFFRKLNYGADRPPFNNSPKQQLSSRNRLPPLHRRKMYRSRVSSNQTNTTASQSHTTGLDSVTSPGSSEKSHNRTSIARNERVPRALHRASPKKEEDTVFPPKPIKHRRSDKKQEPVDYDKDDGGVFRAKSHQEEAMEVEETKDTKVDRPIDQVEAEEVKDEEIESEHPKKSERKPSQPRKSASEPQSEKKESEKKESQETASQEEGMHAMFTGAIKEVKAATYIQAAYRGYKTRSEARKEGVRRSGLAGDDHKAMYQVRFYVSPKTLVKAATKIQSRYRGYRTRKNIQREACVGEAEEDNINTVEREKASIKIQANYRGYKTRQSLKQLQNDAEKEQNEAAVKIQARYRGYKTRREVRQDAKKPALTADTEEQNETVEVQEDDTTTESAVNEETVKTVEETESPDEAADGSNENSPKTNADEEVPSEVVKSDGVANSNEDNADKVDEAEEIPSDVASGVSVANINEENAENIDAADEIPIVDGDANANGNKDNEEKTDSAEEIPSDVVSDDAVANSNEENTEKTEAAEDIPSDVVNADEENENAKKTDAAEEIPSDDVDKTDTGDENPDDASNKADIANDADRSDAADTEETTVANNNGENAEKTDAA